MKKVIVILLVAVTLASCGGGQYLPCPAYANSNVNSGCGYR